MSQTAIVLGAGMVGISTAIYLRKRGWSVVLIDRRGPGEETSYGNAGLIQREAVEPYAMPQGLSALWNIASRKSNDVYFEYGQLPGHLRALWQYWSFSRKAHYGKAVRAYSNLIAHSLIEHELFISEAGARDLVRKNGFYALYRSSKQLDLAFARGHRMQSEFGLDVGLLSAKALADLEPALKQTGLGALHFRDPWSIVDPGGLVARYAAHFERLGGSLAKGDAKTLRRSGAGWSVQTDSGGVEASEVVLALGPWTNEHLKPFGMNITMLRKRGYHQHYSDVASLNAPVFDAERGYVMAPMVKGLRITTGAHLAQLGSPTTEVQLSRAESAAREILPFGKPIEDTPWHGTRPCMPDMLPVIGKVANGLWSNFGHGHQGFTLGPASGALLASLMSGEPGFVDVTPFSPSRWK